MPFIQGFNGIKKIVHGEITYYIMIVQSRENKKLYLKKYPMTHYTSIYQQKYNDRVQHTIYRTHIQIMLSK